MHWFVFKSVSKSLSFESLVLGLLSTGGILCGKSEVAANSGFKQPMNLFCILVGFFFLNFFHKMNSLKIND